MTTDRNCLDAETVAAWADGGLDAAAMAAAEAHASTCARCQALLATVARTLPADSLARGAAAQGTWNWRWWLAPLAATAAAVVVWMVVPQQTGNREPGSGNREAVAQQAAKTQVAPEPAPPAAPAAAAPQPAESQPPARFAEARRNAPPAAQAEKLADAARDRSELGAAAGAERQAPKKEDAGQRADAAGRVMAESPAASAASREQSAELRQDKPATPAAPAAMLQKGSTASIEIVSSDPSRRWRASPDGTIERSEDRGQSWFPVWLGDGNALAGGSSPSPAVCWFVGRRGLVLLAVDGVSFVRLPVPAAVDLVAVSATDGRAAMVTTADGRTFRTTDSGRNWRE